MSESAMEGVLTPAGSQRPKRRARVKAKRKLTTNSQEDEIKRKRTFNTFYTFCNFVLEYEQKLASESVAAVGVAAVGLPRSPVNSAGESSASSTPSSSDSSSNGSDASDLVEGEREPSVGRSAGTEENKQDYTSDDESWNLVTCFCKRPFAGRPMIECSKCKTWIHLFCARVKKDEVPDIYICPSCRPKSS